MSASKNAIVLRTGLYTRRWNVILLLALILTAVVSAHYRAQAAVELVYFRATGVSNGVLLEWETASELDNLGFFVNRSLSRDSGYTQASEFIPTSGDPLLGGYYQFIDTDVAFGTTYWYKLESIDIQSVPEMYAPPVSVMAGTGQTATPTRTATIPVSNQQTGTATPTATARTRTPTVTSTARARSRTPTPALSNPYPAAPAPFGFQQPVQQPFASPMATQEQSASGILTETLVIPISGTATLIPLPEITMEFPSLSISDPAIPTPPSMPPTSISQILRWVTPTRVLIVIFILFVWLFLGGWFYSTIRRLE
jgi:hypothetical protein